MKLIYCDKKCSNTGRCSQIARYRCISVSETGKEYTQWRCEEHKKTATANKKITEYNPFSQLDEHIRINAFLGTLIGKPIFSSFHRNTQPMIGKYLKSNGAIMCRTHRGKWSLVYYHQIKQV